MLSSLTIKYNFGAFLTTYSIMFGLGMGLPYSVLFSVASSKPLSPTSIGSDVKGSSLAWPESSSVVDDNAEDEKARSEPVSYTVAEALRSIDFYIIFFMIFLDVIPITLQTSTYKTVICVLELKH
nr:unnamed protein product [Spirometra erinaceieuropaei]